MPLYKLKFVDRVLTYPEWNGFLQCENIGVQYNVSVIQPEGGTITATPTIGTNGTVITLSNTPDENYEFVSYTVTGATLYDDNKFLISNSDVTVTATFNLTSTVYVDLGTTQYDGTTSTRNVALTNMPSTSSYNYLAFVLDALYDNAGLAADIYFRNSSNGIMWRSRCHYAIGLGFVGITGNVTGWTTESGQSVSSATQDGVSYRLSSKWPKGSWKRIKIVFDRTNNRGYFYIDNTLIGYATMNADMINCKNIGLLKEVSSGTNSHIKNVKVSGFKYLADAQNYNP